MTVLRSVVSVGVFLACLTISAAQDVKQSGPYYAWRVAGLYSCTGSSSQNNAGLTQGLYLLPDMHWSNLPSFQARALQMQWIDFQSRGFHGKWIQLVRPPGSDGFYRLERNALLLYRTGLYDPSGATRIRRILPGMEGAFDLNRVPNPVETHWLWKKLQMVGDKQLLEILPQGSKLLPTVCRRDGFFALKAAQR